MNADRLPLFCDVALAERIERAEARLIASGSQAAHRRTADATGTQGFVIPVAGGVASFAEEGSPLNKVVGLGFEEVPDPAAMEEIEQAFAARGSPVQVELAHLVDPAIGVQLTGRGYRLVSFENVLGRALGGEPERVLPPGVRRYVAALHGVIAGGASMRMADGVAQLTGAATAPAYLGMA